MKLLIDESKVKKLYDFVTTNTNGEYCIKNFEYFRVDLCTKSKYNTDSNISFSSTFVDQQSTYDFDKIIKYIKRFEILRNSYTYKHKLTNEETVYPENTYAVYMSINASNGIKVFNSFKKYYDTIIEKTFSNGLHNELVEFSRLNKKLLSIAHEESNRTKRFIDIDLDIDKTDTNCINVAMQIEKEFKSRNIRFIIIETINGFHFVLDKTTIRFNYVEFINKYNAYVKYLNNKYECIVNDAGFVPVPGTSRNNFEVKIIESIE